jgi:hypothetical protein
LRARLVERTCADELVAGDQLRGDRHGRREEHGIAESEHQGHENQPEQVDVVGCGQDRYHGDRYPLNCI